MFAIDFLLYFIFYFLVFSFDFNLLFFILQRRKRTSIHREWKEKPPEAKTFTLSDPQSIFARYFSLTDLSDSLFGSWIYNSGYPLPLAEFHINCDWSACSSILFLIRIWFVLFLSFNTDPIMNPFSSGTRLRWVQFDSNLYCLF